MAVTPVKDIMVRDVEVVSPDTTLHDAAMIMRDADTGFLPVGEGDRLIGTLTDRDIVIRAVAEGRDCSSATVREAMTDEVAYCFEDDAVNEAVALMGELQVRRLPVLSRDKRLIGIISLGDVATDPGHDEMVGQAIEEISQRSSGTNNI